MSTGALMPLHCRGNACDRTVRTSLFCIFLGRRGIAVRTLLWCDRAFITKSWYGKRYSKMVVQIIMLIKWSIVFYVLRICEITACFKTPKSGCYGYHLFFLSIKKLFTYCIIKEIISRFTCIQVFMSFDKELKS